MFLLFPFLLLGYLLLGLGTSIGIARWAGKQFRSRFVAVLAFAALFAIFFGDEIYGYWHWRHLCNTQGGLHVYKQVPVEGFFINDGKVGAGTAREYLRPTYGGSESFYKFVEGKSNNQLHRYSAGQEGELAIQDIVIDKPSSLYAMSERKISYGLRHAWSYEWAIYDMTTQERIGIARRFGYQGATVIMFFRAITGADKEGSANYCGDTTGFPEAVIPPINN